MMAINVVYRITVGLPPTLCMAAHICMLCMYVHHIQQSMDQPGKVANPARGQLNRENEYSSVPVRA